MKLKRKRVSSSQLQGSCDSTPPCENPLAGFRESLEGLVSIVSDLMKKNRLTPGTTSRLNKQNTTTPSSKNSSLQNSVIVISDSDNESIRENTSVSVIECTPKLKRTPRRRSSMLKPHNKSLKDSSRRKKRKSSVILLDENSSFVRPLDAQESSLNRNNINGENIALSPTEDDVVELWSCLGNSSKEKSLSKRDKTDENIFVIDTRPNYRNLECLSTEGTARKKRKIHRDVLSEKHKAKRHEKNAKKNSKFSRSKTRSSKSQSEKDEQKSESRCKYKLRDIIVDGCNVAMAHTNGNTFSEKGIELVINYFTSRGHVVKVFLPQHVRKKGYQLIEELNKKGTVVFTPSRRIGGRNITSYDDRFILEYATKCKGIVISSDQYRDLYKEKPQWRDTILNRLLSPTFVDDYVMFPEDPLGRNGPDLDTFLRF